MKIIKQDISSIHDFKVGDLKVSTNGLKESAAIGKVQEAYGVQQLILHHNYKLLIYIDKKSGWDAVLLDPEDNIVLYESKYQRDGIISGLVWNALNTIHQNSSQSRTDETKTALLAASNLSRYGEILMPKIANGNEDFSAVVKVSNKDNLDTSIKKLTVLSNLLSNEENTNEEYVAEFKKIFSSKDFVLSVGTKQKVTKTLEVDQNFNNVLFFEYDGGYDGSK